MNLFIHCFYGRVATDSYAKMSDCVYFEMKWQKLPSESQKYVVLMIRNMQKPIYYHGFDVAIMDLNTFIRVSVRCRVLLATLTWSCNKFLFSHSYWKQSLRTTWCSKRSHPNNFIEYVVFFIEIAHVIHRLCTKKNNLLSFMLNTPLLYTYIKYAEAKTQRAILFALCSFFSDM